MAKRYGPADLQDKPYFYTPLPAKLHKSAPPSHANYQTDRLSGDITGVIQACSPVHVANGLIVPWADLSEYGDIHVEASPPSLVAAHFRVNDQRAIPASTLKGVFRSIVEAISYSCPEFKIKKESGKHRGVRVTEISAEHDRCSMNPEESLAENKLCPACRIFGGISGEGEQGGYLGNISFADAKQVTGDGGIFDQMSLYGPQPSYSQAAPKKRTGYKLYFQDAGQTKPLGRKFYKIGAPRPKVKGNYEPVEVCDPGSTFDLRVQFRNLTPGELGLLLMAMGRSAPKDFRLKIGGSKPLSLGTVTVDQLDLTLIDTQAAWSHYELEDSSINDSAKINEYVESAYEENLVHKAAWEKLTQVWCCSYRCPGGEDRGY
jgi:CRISPR/Cas system CSM-associated protein Csm3 (group 7 of RAMP superfamily)